MPRKAKKNTHREFLLVCNLILAIKQTAVLAIQSDEKMYQLKTEI